MYKCKYCGALVNEVKPVENNYYFECKHCGKKAIFYVDLFDIVDNKGENTKDKADSDFEYWWRGYYKK